MSVMDSEAKECFPLPRLPKDLIMLCIEKFSFEDWVKARKCSKLLNEYCHEIKKRLKVDFAAIDVKANSIEVAFRSGKNHGKYGDFLPWDVATEFPILINCICLTLKDCLTSERLAEIHKIFKSKQVQCSRVELEGLNHCSGQDLGYFFEMIKADGLETYSSYLPTQFFDVNHIKKLSYIIMSGSGITDAQFLSLRTSYLVLNGDTLSTKAISQFIQEWKEGKRELDNLDLRFETTTSDRTYTDFLEEILANVIWSPETHYQSIIGRVPLECINEMLKDDPRSFYSIIRSFNIDHLLLIELKRSQILVTTTYCEVETYYSLLDEEDIVMIFHSEDC